MLIQLIYTSKATDEPSHDQLGTILESSVSNNLLRGVTGLLLYSRGTYMQLLEGEAGDVDRVFEHIQTDPRHHDIEVHLRSPAKSREFGDWYMGFRLIRKEDAVAFPNYAPFFENGFDSDRLAENPGACLEIMKAVTSAK